MGGVADLRKRVASVLSLAGRPLDILVPSTCAACGLPGGGLCSRCRVDLLAPPEPICARCGHPAPLEIASCPQCPPGLDRARQAVVYQGPAPALVTALKDRRRRSLALVLAGIVAAQTEAPPAGAVLVPVPLSPRRQAERGFNQSLLIAREVGRLWDVRVVDALERVREGPPQRGAGASERIRQVAAAFRARSGVPVPRTVWLVDDVHTTGATLSACARALRRAGAGEVGAVCFARATSR